MKKPMFLMLLGLMTIAFNSASAQDWSCKSADPAETEVFLYTAPNFKGTCVKLPKVGYNIPKIEQLGIANDSIASVKVGNKVRALVCRDYDYKGDCQSHLQNWNDMSNTVVGAGQISSIKALDKRQAFQLRFNNTTDKAIKIYELVGGVNSYLGTVEPKKGAIIGSDVNTSVTGMADGKAIGGGFQIKDGANPKVINIAVADKGAIQMTLTN
jgi:hypothetical protein